MAAGNVIVCACIGVVDGNVNGAPDGKADEVVDGKEDENIDSRLVVDCVGDSTVVGAAVAGGLFCLKVLLSGSSDEAKAPDATPSFHSVLVLVLLRLAFEMNTINVVVAIKPV